MMPTHPSGAARRRPPTSRAGVRVVLLLAVGVLLIPGCRDPQPDEGHPEAPVGASAPVWFEEQAQSRGLRFKHRSGHSGRHLFPEIIGGGGALFDMDEDGDLDAYLVQSGALDGGSDADRNQLFANDGRGHFEDVSQGSGADDSGYGMGVAVGDYDGDGDSDLYVTNLGPNALLRNDGNGTFTDVSAEAGVAHAGWGTSAAFVDYDRDGDLDLFVVNYVNWFPGIERDCYNPSGALDYCLPTNYDLPATDTLLRNDGDGTFTDVTVEAGLQAAFGNGLGVAVGDFNDDGWPDVFVANDTMMNQLWLNEAGAGFRDEALLWGCAVDEHGLAKAGMGVTVADYDDDGDLDLLVVNLESQTDSFFRNEGGYFSDHTGGAGLGGATRRYTRFGVGLVDFDQDGYLDLYQANGRVVKSSESATTDPFAEPNLVYRGLAGGRFEEVSQLGGAATASPATSRGAAFGDVTGDGAPDVLVVNRDGPAHLFINIIEDIGQWVRFRVLDAEGRDAIGATVVLDLGDRQVHRDVRPAYSYCASSDVGVHVGLGQQREARNVRVLWPDGTLESFGNLGAGRTVELRRGRGGV